ncbi:hypothetical protein QAD02_013391 [Eretmocerus hayati]|uniref:Uncharacterized protein n=1 Tax=Eretmocerus hayati TaxID=131215 RepID=A0ACC2P207_9HYME|nr:hypothetical protein QAD02_013391 [Eretmocerus hayati]
MIQLEDEVYEEFREFERDLTFVQDKKRTVKLQRRIARLCRIIRSALVAQALNKDSTGTIAVLETKLHSATRIAAIVRRRKAKNQKSRVIFFEAESASKKRYRTIVVESVNHLEPKPSLVDAKPFIVEYIRNLLRIRDFGSLKAELIFHANSLLKDGKRSMKNFRVPYHNFLRTTHVGEWYDKGIQSILDRFFDFDEMESGWALEEIIEIKYVECSLRPCNADDSSSDSESEEEEEREGFEDLECEEVKDYNERYDLEEFRRKKKTNRERAAFQEHVPYALGYYYLHRYDESKFLQESGSLLRERFCT